MEAQLFWDGVDVCVKCLLGNVLICVLSVYWGMVLICVLSVSPLDAN